MASDLGQCCLSRSILRPVMNGLFPLLLIQEAKIHTDIYSLCVYQSQPSKLGDNEADQSDIIYGYLLSLVVM